MRSQPIDRADWPRTRTERGGSIDPVKDDTSSKGQHVMRFLTALVPMNNGDWFRFFW